MIGSIKLFNSSNLKYVTLESMNEPTKVRLGKVMITNKISHNFFKFVANAVNIGSVSYMAINDCRVN